MKPPSFRFLGVLIFLVLAGSSFVGEAAPVQEKEDSWMGIFLNGIKVGYIHNQEESLTGEGKAHIRILSESRMEVSRLGDNPMSIVTFQESFYDRDRNPLSVSLITRLSENETEILAEIKPDRIIFKMGGEVVKEINTQGRVYLDIPLSRIIQDESWKAGWSRTFPILDPVAYTLSACRFQVLGREDILIMGEKKNLWHVRSELTSIIPITVDEWVDEQGEVIRADTQTGFLDTVAIRMSEEKARESSDTRFDIAFSTVIPANLKFESPQSVRSMELRLSGLPVERLKRFPWDSGSQEILGETKEFLHVRTVSRVVRDEEAPEIPISAEELEPALKSTHFCQSDDAEIVKTARKIIAGETNSWKAAKKIAEWIDSSLTPNYDVGFASAKEILKNRQGDCTEHTVLFVALCRAVGIPSRAAVGVMYGDGLFVYHMWPEVYVGSWIDLDAKWLTVDQATGEYTTDATHLKFGRSNLDENIFKEMISSISEIIGKLRIEILDYSSEMFGKPGAVAGEMSDSAPGCADPSGRIQ